MSAQTPKDAQDLDTPDQCASDQWTRDLQAALRRATPDGAEIPALEGEILKIKPGYNPNSSSVGSVINVLFWTATASALAVNMMSALLAARRDRVQGPEPDREAE